MMTSTIELVNLMHFDNPNGDDKYDEIFEIINRDTVLSKLSDDEKDTYYRIIEYLDPYQDGRNAYDPGCLLQEPPSNRFDITTREGDNLLDFFYSINVIDIYEKIDLLINKLDIKIKPDYLVKILEQYYHSIYIFIPDKELLKKIISLIIHKLDTEIDMDIFKNIPLERDIYDYIVDLSSMYTIKDPGYD